MFDHIFKKKFKVPKNKENDFNQKNFYCIFVSHQSQSKINSIFETCVLRLPIKIFQLSKAETFPSFFYICFSLKTFHQFYFEKF